MDTFVKWILPQPGWCSRMNFEVFFLETQAWWSMPALVRPMGRNSLGFPFQKVRNIAGRFFSKSQQLGEAWILGPSSSVVPCIIIHYLYCRCSYFLGASLRHCFLCIAFDKSWVAWIWLGTNLRFKRISDMLSQVLWHWPTLSGRSMFISIPADKIGCYCMENIFIL